MEKLDGFCLEKYWKIESGMVVKWEVVMKEKMQKEEW